MFDLFKPGGSPRANSFSPRLVYAIGDVHGRADLLQRMIDLIHQDAAALAAGKPTIVFLGDLIDRGPASRLCLDIALDLGSADWCETICVRGNHEQAMLGFADEGVGGAMWCAHGGEATLNAYGVQLPPHPTEEDWTLIRERLLQEVPQAHWDLLRGMPLWAICGDYLFVHAGVRPNVPLEDQDETDLLWIRQPFLRARRAADQVVVHGHTVLKAPEVKPWRIGLDTGAYVTGVLTAVRLRGYDRDLLQT
ncbi:metallophosphoesterase family protein [Caulobacter segnis]|uniref:metallophosphoesterase family protein n=1 Tax=Caulobacter segnis TaxID=88688 RepID=UPI0026F1D1D8|nr:metallophosphoesterase family protein [Caulobacter segnis]